MFLSFLDLSITPQAPIELLYLDVLTFNLARRHNPCPRTDTENFLVTKGLLLVFFFLSFLSSYVKSSNLTSFVSLGNR